MHRGPLEEKKRRCVAVNASIMHPPAFWIARAWGGPMYTHSLPSHTPRSQVGGATPSSSSPSSRRDVGRAVAGVPLGLSVTGRRRLRVPRTMALA